MKSSLNDEWSTLELLYLSSAVSKNGEENWDGVSEAIGGHIIDKNHPPDWYSAQNCASQFRKLLARIEVPRDSVVSCAKLAHKELKKDRIEELQMLLEEERSRHEKLLKEINMLESGDLDSQLDQMWQEIIDEHTQYHEEEANKCVNNKTSENESTNDAVPSTKTQVDQVLNYEESNNPIVKTEPQELEAPVNISESASIEPVSEVKTEDEEEPKTSNVEIPPITNETKTKSTPKPTPTLDAAEIARREAINKLYDNITDDHVSLKVPESVSEHRFKKTTEIKSEDAIKNSLKRTHDMLTESNEIKDELSDDHSAVDPPRKVTRSELKKDETVDDGKPKISIDDEESRDSSEVKDILMFARSEKRRVYGHDDTMSPVISESTPSSPASTYYGDDPESEKAYKSWKKAIMLIWNDIAAHKYASVFLRPVTEDKVRGYHSVVYKPTDLQTIKRHIETGIIRNTIEFQRELLLMFLNARMYNTDTHDITRMTLEMMKDTNATIEEFNNVQSKSVEPAQKSLRRETREHSKKNDESRRRNDDKSERKRRKN